MGIEVMIVEPWELGRGTASEWGLFLFLLIVRR